MLGSFLAGALAGAADVSHRHAEGEVGLVGLTLSLQQVVHWSLAYPRSIFLQQTDGRLPGVHSQHLLNTVNRETQKHMEKYSLMHFLHDANYKIKNVLLDFFSLYWIQCAASNSLAHFQV